MEFGIQFFPAVGPDQKPADQYWREALELTQLAERLGFTNVRTVEHYFLSYGGYSPDPLIFLSAAAAVEMLVITVLYWKAGDSWLNRGYEYTLLWGLVCFAIALRGGGPYSLDRRIGVEL